MPTSIGRAAPLTGGATIAGNVTVALLGFYCVLHAIAWTFLPWTLNPEHPGDNLEELAQAASLDWGYAKHPPMPVFVIWLASRVFPAGPLLTYVLGAMQVLALLALSWLIARRALDAHRAIIAVLLISCLTYYTNRMHFLNHNTCLMVAYALSVLVVKKAVRHFGVQGFVLLGAAWAVGMYSKYQMVVGIACNVAYVAWVGRATMALVVQRLAVSASVCVLLLVPHLVWLVQNDFPTFSYASQYVGAGLQGFDRVRDVVSFVLDQLMRIAPLALWLWLATRLPGWRQRLDRTVITPPQAAPRTGPLLMIHAWGPFLIMCALSMLMGTDLEMHWGRAFLWMLPIWWLSTVSGVKLATLPLRRLVPTIVALQVVMLASYR